MEKGAVPVVRLSESLTVDGEGPVVVLGANGAGKTRLGASVVLKNSPAFRVPGHRFLVIGTYATSPGNAAISLAQQRDRLLYEPWGQATEIDDMLVKGILQEASASLRQVSGPLSAGSPMTRTILSQVFKLWREAFPGRELVLDPNLEVISSVDGDSSRYPAAQMSDGERTALYLALSCFDAPAGLLIVDEPTIHLHSELARRFWNEIEEARPECRLVYITHDVEFALSRRNARIVIKRPGHDNLQLLPKRGGVPKDVLAALLGAASFAVVAKRVVLCEGEGAGIDERFYSAWFNDAKTAVVPLGFSSHVANAHLTLADDRLIVGANLLSIVDRDDWPHEYLETLRAGGVFVLRVFEVESLYCLQQIVEAVAKHVALSEIGALAEKLKSSVRKRIHGVLLHRLALERTRRALRHRLAALIDNVTPAWDFSEVQSDLTRAIEPTGWSFEPGMVLREERFQLERALDGDWDSDVLVTIPGKEVLGVVAKTLGISEERYKGIVLGALGTDEAYNSIRPAVVEALEGHLPPRLAEST